MSAEVDAETHVAYRRLGRGLFGGVLLTVAIHGAIAVLVYESQRRSAPRPEAVRDYIVTETVTFTKKREKFWLPKVVTPPPPPPPEPVIKLTDNPEAPPVPPEPKEAPKPQDKEISRDLRRALDRARRLAQNVATEEPEGPELATGTGDSTRAVSGDAYFSQVHDAIRGNWTTPAGLINDAQLNALTADVQVQIDGDGSLLNARMTRPSGNEHFDESCMRAVRATGKVPPPPPNMRTQVRRGMTLVFEGKDL
jgi:TonB family protein